MKYILTSGCSFTNNERLNPNRPLANDVQHIPVHRRSWPFYLQQELGKEYTVFNYGGPTNDNVSICRIIFYHIDRLIKEKINPKDITVIIQWSCPLRMAVYMHRQMTNDTHGTAHTLVYHNNWKDSPGVFYLTGGFNPPTGPGTAVEMFGIENVMKYWQAEVMWDNSINTTIHWLETWLLLEKTMKELGINAYYMSMNDVLGSGSGGASFLRHEDRHNWIHKIEILKPYLDKLPINSKRYWHYKDRRGNDYKGLENWAVDNRMEGVTLFQEMVDHGIETIDEYIKQKGGLWGHPSAEMMEIFVKTHLLELIRDELI